MAARTHIAPLERFAGLIHLVRGQKAMLDSDLAALYGVATKVLNQAVKRNQARFPEDFMFQLDRKEVINLRSQIVTSSLVWGGRRARPYVFTEQGVAMLSSVLHSERAVKVNIEIMRAFVRLRQMLASNAELARKLNDLEKSYDRRFRVVFEAIRELMIKPKRTPRREIGFHAIPTARKDKTKSKAFHVQQSLNRECRF